MHTPQVVPFKLRTGYQPCGDQPQAIAGLVSGVQQGAPRQTLLGVTGSGKTFTIANVIQAVQKPTLVIAPNKTLAAQLYSEFKEFFPENRVRYFVSYYDYYQPEAYVPATDTYIEKDAAINDEIDKMRHSATKALLEGSDCIIVASVSCIYGLGAPEDYFNMMFFTERGEKIGREEVLKKLVTMQYTRSEVEFARGNFRVRGETVDIFPSDEESRAVRLVFFADEVEEIREIDALTGASIRKLESVAIYPVSHFVTGSEQIAAAVRSIKAELNEWLPKLREQGKVAESDRITRRTLYDLELLREVGFCPGIENYSRHLAGREPGSAPTTLIDYFPDDFLLVIDESHVTVPQIGGMYRGDRARKETLVNFGFRLPSALDNRPLKFDEFWERADQCIFVSATPGEYEIKSSDGRVIEQINRPTGLLDPLVDVRPATHQVDDLLGEIKKTIEQGDRVLVTTLTKKMAEDLSQYLRETGVKCRYLHSDINAIERVEILRGLRKGDFDVLIGINLLREGLDLVEVSLVAILDADKEGFLRSGRSLIQTMGRAARNIRGRVIMYADQVTESMQSAISEADRRRAIQRQFNADHGIVPRSAERHVQASLVTAEAASENLILLGIEGGIPKSETEQKALAQALTKKMYEAAAKREYELAAQYRDAVKALKGVLITEGGEEREP